MQIGTHSIWNCVIRVEEFVVPLFPLCIVPSLTLEKIYILYAMFQNLLGESVEDMFYLIDNVYLIYAIMYSFELKCCDWSWGVRGSIIPNKDCSFFAIKNNYIL